MASQDTLLVGIIMGSNSDLLVMSAAAQTLASFGISHEVTIVSAHRTPERLFEYAKAAEGRGMRVIIAGAGGSAHLPGMVASLTPLPVIGVPIESKSLKGIDSLYSIVQMPPGVPVATMAINGTKNAALFAASILGVSDESLREKVTRYKEKMKQEVIEKAEKLERSGCESFLKEN